jgi:type IV secretory pathway TraG/TraD family ATPase VirD4
MAGLQSLAQLDANYGRDNATVLRSCFRNLAIFGLAKADPETADMMSRAIGEHDIDCEQPSRSEGPHGITRSLSIQRITKRIVQPRELCEQPNLTARLALAGNRPVQIIRVTPRERPIVAPAFEDASC